MLVVGAGSIGKRHIKNLVDLGARVSVFRYRPDRASELMSLGPVTPVDSLETALDGAPDAVVICNRTDQHLEVALAAAQRALHMFIEKPLAPTITGLDGLRDEVRKRDLVVEVGCMLRFHPTLRRARDLIADGSLGRIYAARAWVGQHLGDWRPGTDYRTSYSARSAQGGGVLLDLIHEIDYLLWMMGDVSEVGAFTAHLSELETDAEDVVTMMLKFESGALGELQLDCVSPIFRRGCEIVGSKGVLSWDYSRNSVKVNGRNPEDDLEESHETFERNQMYLDHMNHFLNRIVSGGPAMVDLDAGLRALEVALAAGMSATSRRIVRPTEVRP